jgi:hypothetical protein
VNVNEWIQRIPRRSGSRADPTVISSPAADDATHPAGENAAERSFPRPLELAQAALLSAGATLLARILIPLVERFGGDDRSYVQMVLDPTDPVATPFALRVLIPWLIRLVGTDPLPTFHVVSLLFLAAGGFCTYLVARGIGAGHRPALLAAFGLLTLRAWLFFIYNPYLADTAALSLTAAAFAALVWGANSAIPAIAAVWALSREIWLGFAIPAYMWLRHALVDLRAAVLVALMLFPAFVVYEMVVKLAPQEGAQGLGRISWWVFVNVLEERITGDFGWYAIYTFSGSLGVWWILALGAARAGGALWWWMVPVFGQFILGTDWARYTVYAFVVVVPVGAIAVWRHPRRNALLVVVALQLVATVADVLVDGRLKLNQIQPSFYITGLLMVLAALVLWTPARWLPAFSRPAPASP